ncbi:MAG: glutathione S-transferase N-terminal domain-containing protein [Synergistaceae bacterium]|nr:glutathione S-transferase N-terminal domain-containing protein [Candidatus Equadaptatus faecalis]
MTVKVYSTPTCPWCDKVKEYLTSKGVSFEIVDISSDRGAAIEMIKKTRQMAVPVTMLNDDFVVGYDTAGIDELLKKAGIQA